MEIISWLELDKAFDRARMNIYDILGHLKCFTETFFEAVMCRLEKAMLDVTENERQRKV